MDKSSGTEPSDPGPPDSTGQKGLKKRKGPKATFLLAVDAWIDTTLYEAGFRLGEFWESLTIFFRRFRVSGWRRLFFELLGEAFTLGAAGSVLMLALALPAFDDTARDWRNQGDFAVTFLDRYGNFIGRRGLIQGASVPVDEMPDYFVKAVLATEDRRFFSHYGIDFIGLGRALTENARADGVVQGGSTITQQLAKNLFLSNERTLERKIKEAFLSVWLECNLTKKEILQLYLDRMYMGGGTFGVTAAANFYFGKDIKDVSLAEAAMLAGLFKAPAKYAPHVNLPAARARANQVLTNLVDAGFMTEGQVLSARLHPATVIDRDDLKSPDYFLDWAFDEVKRIVPRSATHSLVARTTIDMNIQRAAEESLEFNLRQYGKQYDASQGAIVVLDATGAVRAIVGGTDYGASQFNRATRAERQAGSSFKPYVYAVAMEKGLTPETKISGAPINWGGWSPGNYSRGEGGIMTLADALAHSVNTAAVRLAHDVTGLAPVKQLAEAMGVESPLNGHKTMVLGTSGMTVMDQATGYSVFQSGGMAGIRHGIMQLADRSGKVIWEYPRDAPKPRRVLSEKAVTEMNEMLVGVTQRGTGRRAQLPMTLVGGKTGTTQSYRDAWFVGFTGNYTCAVWIGNDDYSPMKRMTGGTVPAMTWERLMAYAEQNIELKPIFGIDDSLLAPKEVESAAGKSEEAPRNERPRLLSSATTKVLKAIAKMFEEAPVIDTPIGPEALSSL
jgi:penicillin-binding protein 1A